MNIQELITELQDIANTDPDIEVRLAMQPSWPFEYDISRVAYVDPTYPEYHDLGPEDADVPDDEADRPPVVYLVEGSQLGYLPQIARGVFNR